MEVKDAFSLYAFMEQLGHWGAIVFSILITLISGYLVANVLEKIVQNRRVKAKIIIAVLLTVFSCMLVIAFKTIGRNKDIAKASAIKSYMVMNKWKFIGFKRAAKEINLSYSELAMKGTSDKKRVKEIEDLVDEFPSEFQFSSIFDQDTTDKLGIYLVDTSSIKAINNYYESLIPYFKAKITEYMRDSNRDTMTFVQLKQLVDPRLDDDILEQIGARYKDLLIPINFYANPADITNYIFAYRMNIDSFHTKTGR
jgi:hypothetical protein